MRVHCITQKMPRAHLSHSRSHHHQLSTNALCFDPAARYLACLMYASTAQSKSSQKPPFPTARRSRISTCTFRGQASAMLFGIRGGCLLCISSNRVSWVDDSEPMRSVDFVAACTSPIQEPSAPLREHILIGQRVTRSSCLKVISRWRMLPPVSL